MRGYYCCYLLFLLPLLFLFLSSSSPIVAHGRGVVVIAVSIVLSSVDDDDVVVLDGCNVVGTDGVLPPILELCSRVGRQASATTWSRRKKILSSVPLGTAIQTLQHTEHCITSNAL